MRCLVALGWAGLGWADCLGHHEDLGVGKSPSDHHSHGTHFPRNISKLKDRVIGRVPKAGNHLHSTNR